MVAVSQGVRILGVAGSLRVRSFNRALLRAAHELAPEGMEIRDFDIAGIPSYNADVQDAGWPAEVASFKAAIREADGLLFVTPEYNYGVPGVLKNAIDWASRAAPGEQSPLTGKPAGIMGASTGMSGSMRAQLQLRHAFVFTQTYALTAPEVLVARAQEKFDAEGRLTDSATREAVRAYLVRLADWARRLGVGARPEGRP
jgi:chromate reductase, NAD(P)H dehydrogenase (quinone)